MKEGVGRVGGGGDGCFGLSFQLELETCTTRYCRAYNVVCYREKKQIMKQTRYEDIRENSKRQETNKGKERKKKKSKRKRKKTILKQRSKDLNEDMMEVHFPKFMSEILTFCATRCSCIARQIFDFNTLTALLFKDIEIS